MALSWRETIVWRNPFALAAFVQLCTMVYYFPANNQCLQSGETVTAFWGTVICWQVVRRQRASYSDSSRAHVRIRG
jgi:hypothetical protein